MYKRRLTICVVAIMMFAILAVPINALSTGPTVPAGFKATRLASGLATYDGLRIDCGDIYGVVA